MSLPGTKVMEKNSCDTTEHKNHGEKSSATAAAQKSRKIRPRLLLNLGSAGQQNSGEQAGIERESYGR